MTRHRSIGVGAGASLAAAVALAMALAASAAHLPQGQAAPVFPGAEWDRIADPRAAGFCQAGLDAATAEVRKLATTGMVVVVGGRVLWEYGDLQTVTYLASVRKSILAMLYGRHVEQGTISLAATIADLGIDDVDGLLPAEKQATVADLLAARSGVYHEAANAACTGCGSTAGDPPGPRGSVPHGSYFLYNNWDFNALGTIFEQRTGLNIYDAFEQDLARPTRMQDFTREAQRKTVNARASVHPAYHFYLSTRDMARVGYVMLRGGEWAGKPLVPRAWVRRMVTPVTRVADMNPADLRKGPFGYGFLWWIWDRPHDAGPYAGAYTGIGAVGQFLTVLPAVDMVIAHKTRQGAAAVSRSEYLGVVDRILAARCAGAAPRASGDRR
jgi:CubicO group peptidase (beta-lactamase class C family)